MLENKFFSKQILLSTMGLLLCVALCAQRQEPKHSCAVEMDTTEWALHRKTVAALRSQGVEERNGEVQTLYVGVQMHIVRSSDGDDGLTSAEVLTAFNRANEKYAPVNIQFFYCNVPNIIESDTWFDTEFQFEWTNECGANNAEYDLTDQYNVPGLINIYWVNTNGWSWSAGPGAIESACMDWVIMHQGHADSYRTLAHELGHYLGLPHTFSGFNENVTRNAANACHNCDTAGDLFCDTPADHHNDDPSDEWVGCNASNKYDDCGVLLTPDPLNIMSYSHCNTDEQYFSAEQRATMRYKLTHNRTYLTCESSCALSRNMNAAFLHSTFSTFRAQTEVVSAAKFADGVAVYYEAEDRVRLLPGFQAQTGVTFSAKIQNCGAAAAVPDLAAGKTVLPPSWSAKLVPVSTTDATTLVLDVPEDLEVSVWLIGMDGRLSRSVAQGVSLSKGIREFPIDCSGLPPGVFRVLVQSNAGLRVLPLVKL